MKDEWKDIFQFMFYGNVQKLDLTFFMWNSYTTKVSISYDTFFWKSKTKLSSKISVLSFSIKGAWDGLPCTIIMNYHLIFTQKYHKMI